MANLLRIGLIDMNNGVDNQGMRCFHGILRRFRESARLANPDLRISTTIVEPRNKGEAPPSDCDLYISTGGPGSPFDGADEPWAASYRSFIDRLVERSHNPAPPSLFGVCFSFELLVVHLGVATMQRRASRKFGIMPIYPTGAGRRSKLFEPFGHRLYAFEHRSWEAVDPASSRLEELSGALLARESSDGKSKGRSCLSFRFARNIHGNLFHPEADRAGALAWMANPEQAALVMETYGQVAYLRMLKTLDDPMRLARTYALMVPGWLARRFNLLAKARGLRPIPLPSYDPSAPDAFGKAPVTEDRSPILVEASAGAA